MARQTSGSEDSRFFAELATQLSGDASWVLEWVAGIFSPDDVFAHGDLEDWARENGFIHQSECE